MYRARQTDAEQNRPRYADPIGCPVLAVGAQDYLADEVSKQLAQVAHDVRGVVIRAAGHNIALENPAALAQAYLDFFARGSAVTAAPPPRHSPSHGIRGRSSSWSCSSPTSGEWAPRQDR